MSSSHRTGRDILIFTALLLAPLAAGRAADGPSKLNVLFLFADDQRAVTIAALGNPVIQTPAEAEVALPRADFDDLCRVHLFDWLEQVPRSQLGWDYRREAFQRMAERLGGTAKTTYDRVFAEERTGANVG